MTDPSFSEELLRTINEKHISPKPKWEFLMKDWAVWTAGVLSILVGGIAVGLIITVVRTDDLHVLQENNADAANLLILIPYFWIAVLIGFLVIAGLNLKHTRRGYRLRLPLFALIVIGLSVILGVCFYDVGIGQMIDASLTERPGRYLEFIHPRAELWSRPSAGTLGGIVLDIPDQQTIVLNDFSNHKWIVHVSNPNIDLNRLPIHARIRCIGSQLNDNEFVAVVILPWGTRRTILIPLPPPPNHQFFEEPVTP